MSVLNRWRLARGALPGPCFSRHVRVNALVFPSLPKKSGDAYAALAWLVVVGVIHFQLAGQPAEAHLFIAVAYQ
jgi:hypothetical protein